MALAGYLIIKHSGCFSLSTNGFSVYNLWFSNIYACFEFTLHTAYYNIKVKLAHAW